MTPALERRIARAFKQAAIVTPDERSQIVRDAQDAEVFQDLPAQTQALLLELEQRTADQRYALVGGVVVAG